MPTLGEELRRRREERGTSLGDISEATRIGTRFLKAIESDNFSILPGGIFTRSFIRAYAKQVGMNEDEAVSLYQQQITGPVSEPQAVAKQTTVEPARKAAIVENRPRRAEPMIYRQGPTRTNWSTIIIAGGIILFIVIIVLALVKQLNRSGSEGETQTAAAPPAAQKADPPPAPTTTQPEQSPATSTPAVQPGDSIVVKLEATTAKVWLRYQADDAKPVTLELQPGQVHDIPAAQAKVKLNIGDRQALKLKINNRDAIFPEGTKKFGAELVITRDNLQTFIQ